MPLKVLSSDINIIRLNRSDQKPFAICIGFRSNLTPDSVAIRLQCIELLPTEENPLALSLLFKPLNAIRNYPVVADFSG